MKSLKKTLPFILLNIAVSALTVVAVLLIWEHIQHKRVLEQAQAQSTQSNPLSELSTPETNQNTSVPSKIDLPEGTIISIQNVFGLGDLNLEYILVKNEGDSKLSLLNWSLRGAERKSIHIKSDIILNPGGAIKIYSKTGTDSALAIYLNSEEAFWQSGAIVTLHDPELVERARYEIP